MSDLDQTDRPAKRLRTSAAGRAVDYVTHPQLDTVLTDPRTSQESDDDDDLTYEGPSDEFNSLDENLASGGGIADLDDNDDVDAPLPPITYFASSPPVSQHQIPSDLPVPPSFARPSSGADEVSSPARPSTGEESADETVLPAQAEPSSEARVERVDLKPGHVLDQMSDPARDWAMACQFIRPGNIQWDRLGYCDRVRQKTFEGFTPDEREVWFQLFNLLRQYVTSLELDGAFDQPDRKYVWHWQIWAKILDATVQRCATALAAHARARNNCVLARTVGYAGTFFGVDRGGYPKYTISVGQYQKRSGAAVNRNARNRWSWYDTHQRCGMNHARIMAILGTSLRPLRNQQASHLCYHNPPVCIAPWHLVWEVSVENKSRNFDVNSTGHFCRHTPACVFVDDTGRFLPCRNDDRMHLQCDDTCVMDCFKRRVF